MPLASRADPTALTFSAVQGSTWQSTCCMWRSDVLSAVTKSLDAASCASGITAYLALVSRCTTHTALPCRHRPWGAIPALGCQGASLCSVPATRTVLLHPAAQESRTSSCITTTDHCLVMTPNNATWCLMRRSTVLHARGHPSRVSRQIRRHKNGTCGSDRLAQMHRLPPSCPPLSQQ